MPRWTTRLLGWARDNLFRRARPRPLSAAVGHEQAGAARWTAPVPWTADAAVVDVLLRLPPHARRKSDFGLRLPNATVLADSFRPEIDDRFRVGFRFPVPADSIHAELVWRHRPLGTVAVQVLTRDAFLGGLTLTNVTTVVRYSDTTAAVSAFVPVRCDALLTTAVLRSPVLLAPFAELRLRALFLDDQSGRTHTVTVPLNAAQLTATEAVVTAVCPEAARHPGGWWVTWTVEERLLTTHRVRAIPAEVFEARVRLAETRFAIADAGGTVRTVKVPPPAGAGRVGPVFVLIGGEAGAAGLCRFEVRGVTTGEPCPDLTRETEAVVTDAPTAVVPALFDAPDLARVSGFELRLNGRLLGLASLRPVPAAAINAEGGFTPPTDFAWSAAAEDELADRLKRLSG